MSPFGRKGGDMTTPQKVIHSAMYAIQKSRSIWRESWGDDHPLLDDQDALKALEAWSRAKDPTREDAMNAATWMARRDHYNAMFVWRCCDYGLDGHAITANPVSLYTEEDPA